MNMKKLLTFVVMAMMAVSASAQLVAERDWTGGFEGDYPFWCQFGDDQEGSITSDADGVAITLGTQTGQLWQPQAIILQGFDLAKNGNYTVAIVAKFPCNGQLQISMGNWEYNQEYDIPVNATGDFQEVEVEFPGYIADATNAHVRFQCGDFKGTTIVKSVQVFEGDLANDKWTLVGDKKLVGVDWDNTSKKNRMFSLDGENYKITKNEILLSRGTYYFNVFKENAPSGSYPSSNASLVINEDGVYNVSFIFNVVTKQLSATTTKVEVWTIAGDENLLGVNWDATERRNKMTPNGLNYTLQKTDLTLPKGTYQYKVYKNMSQQNSYPESNASLVIEEDATYTIVFTFNPNTKEVSATATKTDGLYFNYITKGKVAELVQNPRGYKGTIIIPSTITHEGVDYSVAKISESAFYGCSRLTSVTIPSSITSIVNGTFSGCSSLTSVTIPNSVTSIGDWAFSGCSSLTSITIPQKVTSIGYGIFSSCTSLTSITIPNSVTSIGANAFSGCTGLTSITIPNSVTSIGSSAFYGCTGLTSITIPNSVTSIGNYAFQECSGLTSITIPNNVTSIGERAFSDCTALTSVTIPNSVTSIDYNAFQNCNNMSSVTIGEKVSSISPGAFANCQQLTDVFCLAENVPNTTSDVFNYSYIEYATLHVPVASLSSYSNSEPWKNFKNIVALEEGDIPVTQKCATPTIKFENGVVKFSCATEGAEFISTITPVGNNTKYDSQIVINNTYKVTVYATKAGYNNSDAATIEIQTNSGVKGDLNADGKVNVADHVELSKIILNQ